MRRLAQTKAAAECLRAQRVTISTYRKFKNRLVIVTRDDRQEIALSETLLSVIRKQSNGNAPAWPVVGTWLSRDGSAFYLAIGTTLEDAPRTHAQP